mmetsp:Transcript_27334/g.64870  ORF Transcript_27334/g.64870 Transcript_27334/m.64870 type:complete len:171 (+) Transcript_27334:140-652(+)
MVSHLNVPLPTAIFRHIATREMDPGYAYVVIDDTSPPDNPLPPSLHLLLVSRRAFNEVNGYLESDVVSETQADCVLLAALSQVAKLTPYRLTSPSLPAFEPYSTAPLPHQPTCAEYLKDAMLTERWPLRYNRWDWGALQQPHAVVRVHYGSVTHTHNYNTHTPSSCAWSE